MLKRRRVAVDSFWMGTTPVINREYAQFIEATDYRTVAETAPDPAQYPRYGAKWHGLDRWYFKTVSV